MHSWGTSVNQGQYLKGTSHPPREIWGRNQSRSAGAGGKQEMSELTNYSTRRNISNREQNGWNKTQTQRCSSPKVHKQLFHALLGTCYLFHVCFQFLFLALELWLLCEGGDSPRQLHRLLPISVGALQVGQQLSPRLFITSTHIMKRKQLVRAHSRALCW